LIRKGRVCVCVSTGQ